MSPRRRDRWRAAWGECPVEEPTAAGHVECCGRRSCGLNFVIAHAQTQKIVQHELDGERRLLRNDTVAQCSQLSGPRYVDGGHPAWVEAHEPFDEYR